MNTMTSNRYNKAKEFITEKLKTGLNGRFQYHNLDHVMDVLEAANRLGKSENIDETEMELLRAAVMYHDSGYTTALKDHEKLSCEIVDAELPGFGYNRDEVKIICGLIMATKIPQNPQTRLQQIICDADLDYLGRDDFFDIGDKLYLEFKKYGMLDNEHDWHLMQESFLENHRYFTPTAIKIRESKKQENLLKVKSILGK
jgi:uncharacterized protein